MFDPGRAFTWRRSRRPRGKGSIDIEVSAPENLESLAKALGRPVRDLTAVILDRPATRS